MNYKGAENADHEKSSSDEQKPQEGLKQRLDVLVPAVEGLKCDNTLGNDFNFINKLQDY